jgi:hypothetical protein
MTEHGICAKCKKSVGCSYADDRITGCKKFVLEPGLELANEEWLRSATTEQLPEFLAGIINTNPCGYLLDCNECGLNDRCREDDYPSSKEAWCEWLKQPHTTE